MSYVSLHTHTHYSLLDGKSTIPELVGEAVRQGMPALAITDHGNCFGHYEFFQECTRVGIKPILGSELYYAPAGRERKEPLDWYELEGKASPGRYTHLTAWALGAEGLRNLYQLSREANDTGFYYKPRADIELLGRFAGGIAVSTGCMGGEVATHLRAGEVGRAERTVSRLREVFSDRLFIEVMNHGIPGEDVLIEQQLRLADKLSVPAIATNDSHYTFEEDAFAHSCLLGVQTRSKLSDPKRFAFNGSGYHLAGLQALSSVLPVPRSEELLRGTLAVANMVDGSYGGFFLPRDLGPTWEDSGDDGVLALLQRLRKDCPPWEPYTERLEYEWQTITSLGFTDYFLVLADAVRFCRTNGIRVGPCRGSVGGSLVAYLMGITEVDPIAHGLLFERFLNPQRVSAPDIDIDVQDDRREEVLRYLSEKYGPRRVATVMALNTIGAKAALHDATFVLGESRTTSNTLVNRLPPMVRGRAPSLAEMDTTNLSATEERIVEVAQGMEGLIRSASQHAAAVIISREDLTNTLPVWTDTKTKRHVTGFDAKTCDKLGLTKFDLLGLKTLRVIDECMRLVSALPNDDGAAALRELSAESTCSEPSAYQLLASGNTLGCFQVEGAGMQRLLRSVQPTSLGDVAAVLALYRPGPMDRGSHEEYAKRKHGRAQVEYPHPELAAKLSSVLDPTYGLIVYQEQVMEILNRVCGWGYAEAEVVFNALRKKDRVGLARSEPAYLGAGRTLGYSHEALTALWDVLLPFADYSFNKSHAVGYAILTYRTAYLKANYLPQFMAALLSAEDDATKQEAYVHEAAKLGVRVEDADINESASGWTVTSDGRLLRGLASIRGIGNSVVRDIVSERPYLDLNDFLRRLNRRSLRTNAVMALFRANAGRQWDVHGSEASDREITRVVEAATAIRDAGVSGSLLGSIDLRLQPVPSFGSSIAPGKPVRLSDPLTPEEWLFVILVCRKYPGSQRLHFNFKGRTIRVPVGVSQVPPELNVISKITIGEDGG